MTAGLFQCCGAGDRQIAFAHKVRCRMFGGTSSNVGCLEERAATTFSVIFFTRSFDRSSTLEDSSWGRLGPWLFSSKGEIREPF